MIVKFFKRGSGSCKATIDYLIGKNNDRQDATVLHGDARLTQQLADSLEFSNRYTVGVLSFAEADLDNDKKQEIMREFERTLLAGLDKDQYNICWIQHQDKGRLELNFVIPKVELSTGKSLNPYFDAADRERVNAFKDHYNAKFDLHDPNDPANREALTANMALPADKKALQSAITSYLSNEIAEGRVTDRQGVKNALERDLGLSIARVTPSSISIKDPNNENGRNIRLKGEIYEQAFRFGADYRAENERARQDFSANRGKRIQTTRETLERLTEAKREFNTKLYSKLSAGRTSEAGREQQQPARSSDTQKSLGMDSAGRAGRVIHRVEHDKHRDSKENHRKSSVSRQHNTANRTITATSSSTSESSDWQERRRNTLDRAEESQESRSRKINEWQAFNAAGVTDYAKRLFGNVRKLIERTRTTIERVRADNSTARADNTAKRRDSQLSERADRAIDSTERAIIDSKQQLDSSKQAVADLSKQAQALADRGMSR